MSNTADDRPNSASEGRGAELTANTAGVPTPVCGHTTTSRPAWLAAMLALCICSYSFALSIFHIGNSVTDQSYGATDVAKSLGDEGASWGRFMIPGAPLEWLWEHGGSGLSGFSSYDAVVLQPFSRPVDNAAQFAGNFAELAFGQNPDIRVYILAAYPFAASGDFHTVWNGALQGDIMNAALFEGIQDRVNSSLSGGKSVYMVPFGYALDELHTTHGVNIATLYRDGVHLNTNGKYVQAVSVYATVYRSDPHGATTSGLYFWEGAYSVSHDFAEKVWDAVWTAVTRMADRAGVSEGAVSARCAPFSPVGAQARPEPSAITTLLTGRVVWPTPAATASQMSVQGGVLRARYAGSGFRTRAGPADRAAPF